MINTQTKASFSAALGKYLTFQFRDNFFYHVNCGRITEEIGYYRGRIYMDVDGNVRELKVGRFLSKYWYFFVSRADNTKEEAIASYGKDHGTFISKYASQFPSPKAWEVYTHKIVQGDDIVKYYDKVYWNSCMHNKPQTAFYAQNPGTFRMLVLFNEGEYCGRALLWNTEEGYTYMDRVYPGDMGPHFDYAVSLAMENGWVYRADCSAPTGERHKMMLDGEGFRDVLTARITEAMPYHFYESEGSTRPSIYIPYQDSLYYCKRTSELPIVLSTSTEGLGSYYTCHFHSTPPYRVLCSHSEKWYAKDICRLIDGKYYSPAALRELFIMDHRGQYIRKEDAIKVAHRDGEALFGRSDPFLITVDDMPYHASLLGDVETYRAIALSE